MRGFMMKRQRITRDGYAYHVSYDAVGMGRLCLGRHKSFPVQDDCHYLTALRCTADL